MGKSTCRKILQKYPNEPCEKLTEMSSCYEMPREKEKARERARAHAIRFLKNIRTIQTANVQRVEQLLQKIIGARAGRSTCRKILTFRELNSRCEKVIGARTGKSTCRKILQTYPNEPCEVLREVSSCYEK